MPKIQTVEIADGDLIRIGRAKKLNGQFIPVSRGMMGCDLFRLMKDLPSGTLRFLLGLLQDHDGDHVKYVTVNPENNVHYRLLELNKIVLRLPADVHPRRKGFTTVMISPFMIATREQSIIDLWSRGFRIAEQSGLSTAQQELQP